MGLHPPRPLLQFTPLKFENLINLIQKHSNLALYGILVLNKSRYPMASGRLCPPDPLLHRYYTSVSPIPYIQYTLILTQNPGSAPAYLYLATYVCILCRKSVQTIIFLPMHFSLKFIVQWVICTYVEAHAHMCDICMCHVYVCYLSNIHT